jgi:hypothetical protein
MLEGQTQVMAAAVIVGQQVRELFLVAVEGQAL